jgi:hypothetical protein
MWINYPPLVSNGIHYIKFLHHMDKLLLNLVPSQPLSLLMKLHCFNNIIELYVMLVSTFHLGVHVLIVCNLLNTMRV